MLPFAGCIGLFYWLLVLSNEMSSSFFTDRQKVVVAWTLAVMIYELKFNFLWKVFSSFLSL